MNFRYLKFLSSADFLEDTQAIHLVSIAASTICLILLALIIWSSWIALDEITVTRGKVIPQGSAHQIQHLEGGIVSAIHVSEGKLVEKGAPLISLSDNSVMAELERYQSREATLLLDIARLQLSLGQAKGDQAQLLKTMQHIGYGKQKNQEKLKQIVDNDLRLLQLQKQYNADQTAFLQAQIDEHVTQAKHLEQQVTVIQKHLALLEEEKSLFQSMKKTNKMPKMEYLTVLHEINSAHGQLANVHHQQQQNSVALREAKYKLKEFSTTKQKANLQELGELQSELHQIQHNIEKLSDRLKRLQIVAPERGFIKGLAVHIGSVIPPAKPFMELVPTNKPLVIETRIQPADIGHVTIADPVAIKVLTYDFVTYGVIQGELTAISASTFLDAQNKPYYRGVISLKQDYVGDQNHGKRLMPGMDVEADIITGKKSLLSYILKPLHRSAASSFHER